MSESLHYSDAGVNGIGARLQAARQRAALSLVQAAERLHVDPNVIQALESEQFGQLGATVYVRGHLRHYAELVKESAPELLGLYADNVRVGQAPDLTQMPHVKPDSSQRSALVVAGTAIAIGVGLVGSARWVYLDLHPAAPVIAPLAPAKRPAPRAATAPVVGSVAAVAAATAAVASSGPVTGAAVSAPSPVLPKARPHKRAAVAEASVTLKFNSACWTEVFDARGRPLYRGIGEAGDVAHLQGPAPLKVVVGNVAVVDVEINGQMQPIPAAEQIGRTAEFLVTQAGELAPVRTVTTAGNKP